MEIITRKEAKEQGLKRYFTGKPCKYGHIDERVTQSGHCYTCKNERQRQNRDYFREYWAKNKERRKAILEKYHKSDTRKQYWDKYYSANKQRIIDYQYEYRNNPENVMAIKDRSSKYRASHKAELNEKKTRRKKQVKRATPEWVSFSKIQTKYKERDAMTALTGIEHHVDHKIPLQGENVCGLHVHNNLRVIPARDNLRKSNRLA